MYEQIWSTSRHPRLESHETFAERFLRLRQYLNEKRIAGADVSAEELVLSFSWLNSAVPVDAIYAFAGLAWGNAKVAFQEWQELSLYDSILQNTNWRRKPQVMKSQIVEAPSPSGLRPVAAASPGVTLRSRRPHLSSLNLAGRVEKVHIGYNPPAPTYSAPIHPMAVRDSSFNPAFDSDDDDTQTVQEEKIVVEPKAGQSLVETGEEHGTTLSTANWARTFTIAGYDVPRGDATPFMRFVSQCIRLSGSMDIICRSWAPQNSRMLPSWIKRVREQGTLHHSVRVVFVNQPGRELYNASAAMYPSYRFSDPINLRSRSTTISKRRLLKAILLERLSDLEKISTFHSLFATGIPLGTIQKMSPRISQGLITRKCLEIGGILFPSKQRPWKSGDIPSSLWRTLVADRTATGDKPPSWYPGVIASCLNKSVEGDLSTGALVNEDETPTALFEVLSRIRDVTWNRKLILVGGVQPRIHHLGLAPANAQDGDHVCVLLGCSVPVLLRPLKSRIGPVYELIGECFLFGFMDGEAVTGEGAKKLEQMKEFILK